MSEDFEMKLVESFNTHLKDFKERTISLIWKIIAAFGVLMMGGIFWAGATYNSVKRVEQTVNNHIESEAGTVGRIERKVDEVAKIVYIHEGQIKSLSNERNSNEKH